MTLADDVDKHPIANPVNQPKSGTYGAVAETERIASAMPDPTPVEQPPTPSPQGVTNVRSNRDAASMPGVPAPLMAPSNRPGVPVNTPLAGPGGGAAVATPAQRRLQVLDHLANSQEVTEETREWAQLQIRILTE